jgi:acyl carrier protein
MNRNHVVDIVIEAVRDQLDADGAEDVRPITEDTPLIGGSAPIDSLGLVTVIVELEQRLQSDYGVMATLVDEQAMSQRYSPFRTVGTLADYAVEVVGRGEQ